MASSATLRAFIPNWGPPSPGVLLAHFPAWLAFATLAALALALAARARTLRALDVLSALGLFALGLHAIRFLPNLPLAIAPAVAAGLTPLLARIPRLARACLPLAALAVVAAGAPRLHGVGLEAGWYPERGLRTLQRNQAHDRLVLNALHYGGYLLFHGARPLVDGRADQVYPEPLLRDAIEATRDEATFDRLDRRYRFGALFLDGRPEQRAARFLARRPEWALVHWDDRALVYLRTAGSDAAIAFTLLDPCDAVPSLGRALVRSRGDDAIAARLRSEIERRLADGSRDLEAHALAALYFHALGPTEAARAARHLDAAIRIAPRHEAVVELARRLSSRP